MKTAGAFLSLFVAASAAEANGMRMIADHTRAEDKSLRNEECLAFVDAVRIYLAVLRGLSFALGRENTHDVAKPFEWVYDPAVVGAYRRATNKGQNVNRDLVDTHMDSFGPVSLRNLIPFMPVYQQNKELCLATFGEEHVQTF